MAAGADSRRIPARAGPLLLLVFAGHMAMAGVVSAADSGSQIARIWRAQETPNHLLLQGAGLAPPTELFVNQRRAITHYDHGWLRVALPRGVAGPTLTLTARDASGAMSAPVTVDWAALAERSLRSPWQADFRDDDFWQAWSEAPTRWRIDNTGRNLSLSNPAGGRVASGLQATLTSAALHLGALSAPELQWRYRWPDATATDRLYAELSTDDGQTWQSLTEIRGAAQGWRAVGADLTAWTDAPVRVRLRFRAGPNSPTALHITDLAIADAKPVIAEVYTPSPPSDEVVVTGANLHPRAQVWLDGRPVATQATDGKLRFRLPLGPTPPAYRLQVCNPDGALSTERLLMPTQLTPRLVFAPEFTASDWGRWAVQAAGARWQYAPVENHERGILQAIPQDRRPGDRVRATLISPPLDLSGMPFPALTFRHRLAADANDHLLVDVSTDNGASWTNLYTTDAALDTLWRPAKLDLAAYAGQPCRLRFVYGADDAAAAGLHLDEVRVASAAPTLEHLHAAADGQLLLAARFADARTMLLVNGQPVTARYQPERGFTFVPPPSVGRETLRLRVCNPDGAVSPEIAVRWADLPPLDEAAPYRYGFAISLASWQPASNNETIWHHYQLEAAPGGCARAGVPHTNRYSPDADTTLTSPPLELRDFVAPHIEFDHHLPTDGSEDRLHVEVHSESHPHWETVFTAASDNGDASRPAAIDLTPHRAGMCRIRFRFTSGAAGVGLGALVDNVRIASPPPTITSTARRGGPDSKLVVYGDNFDYRAVLVVDGRAAPTRYDDGRLVTLAPSAPSFRLTARNLDGRETEPVTVQAATLPEE